MSKSETEFAENQEPPMELAFTVRKGTKVEFYYRTNNRRSRLRVTFKTGSAEHVILNVHGIDEVTSNPPFIQATESGSILITGITGVLEAHTPEPSIDLTISTADSFRTKLNWTGLAANPIEESASLKVEK